MGRAHSPHSHAPHPGGKGDKVSCKMIDLSHGNVYRYGVNCVLYDHRLSFIGQR